MISTAFKEKNVNLSLNSSVFRIRLFDVRFLEYDVRKIETCRGISGLYVKVYILILVCLLALSMKLLNNAWI